MAPALGKHRLEKLTPLHIQRYYSQAMASGRRRGTGPGLTAQTVQLHHRVLRQALQQAVRWQLLARNPADAVDPPRPRPAEMPILDEADSVRLLAAARGSRTFIPVLLALTTGLRAGEILGLHWQDVDLGRAQLAVRQTLEQTKAGRRLKEPKTPRSRRAIAMPPLLVAELGNHRREQARERLRLGPLYRDHGLVCPQLDGGLWSPTSLSKMFQRLVAAAEVPRVRFHDLRHTHASQLLRQGVHPKIVSERLGHATVAITLDRYSHVLPGLQEQAALQIDGALRAAGFATE